MPEGLDAPEVEDIDPRELEGADALVRAMARSGGFTARELGVAVDILEEAVRSEAALFLSFPADLVATGTRGVLRALVQEGLADVLVTTCGTLDHDIARCHRPYYQGAFHMNDADLHRRGVNRLGNVLVPNESYGVVLEELLQPFLGGLWEEGTRGLTTRDLTRRLGKALCDESSILWWAAEREVPVFIPGPTDGAVGYQLWAFWQEHRDFALDLFGDEAALMDAVYDAEGAAGLLIGGGISKHHVLWWNQFRGGLDRAVYLTTATEYDGSLSGARPREAVSWGKIREEARSAAVIGDATVTLPLIAAALLERLR